MAGNTMETTDLDASVEAEGGSEAVQALPVQIDSIIAAKVSFATQQNAVPIIRDLQITNNGQEALHDLVVEMTAEPAVFAPKQWRLDRIGAGSSVRPSDRDLALNAALLMELTEAVSAQAKIRVMCGEITLLETSAPIELLARNEWGGAAAMPELLAAFVQPNDIAVSRVLKAASEVLRRAGKPDGLNGYQEKSRTRSYELASAIWSAVSGLGLSYAVPPASFEIQGQKVRTPSQILESGLATCLDTALLFSACLEQAGLYPVLVMTRGHAFSGVWLQPQEFSSLLVEDPAALRKRVALQELLLFETTLASQRGGVAFSRAISQANQLIAEEQEAEFVMALDVRRARMQRLRPLALPQAGMAGEPVIAEAAAASEAFEESPLLPAFDLTEHEGAAQTPQLRLERWQRKLLNLTTSNRLLNADFGAGPLKLRCPDPAALEDRLAAGEKFKIVPAPRLEGAAGRDVGLHQVRTGEALDEAYAASALERSEIISPLDKDKLEAALVALYRKARTDLAEGGANTLFLVVGFLNWKKSPTDTRSYRAPLILVPVKLERGSVRSGIRLSLYDDEARFNLTLLQMLRQDFELDLPDLADKLPADESGVDVPKIWNRVRHAVRDMPGFEVTEDVALSAFSFAKYLMWKDLTDRTEALKANPIVRHLLETPKEPYRAIAEPPRADELDREVEPANLFTPLPADSSQLAAVVGSARGCDFVLDGPPGTGKSQTIANMIAHNLALGRKVLFVAEKRAALDVVYRRLVEHQLGPFCLELHSNKAVKLEVLSQLDGAWTAAEANPAYEWKLKADELKRRRDELNGYVSALHRQHANGMTLHQAIGRVVDRGDAMALRLNWPPDVHHDAAALTALREAARRLDLNRPRVGADVFASIGCVDWSNAWQGEILAAAGALSRAAIAATETRQAFLKILGVRLPSNKAALSGLADLSVVLPGTAGVNFAFAFEPDAVVVMERCRAALQELAAYRSQEAGLSVRYAAQAACSLPLDAMEAQWAKAQAAFWPLSIFAKMSVVKALSPAGMKADPAHDLPRLKAMRTHLDKLDGLGGEVAACPGWNGIATDEKRVAQSLEVAQSLRTALAAAAQGVAELPLLRSAVRALVVDANEMVGPDGAAGRAAEAWQRSWQLVREALERFTVTAMPAGPLDAPELLDMAREVALGVQAGAVGLNAWCAWQRVRREAMNLGLERLADAVADNAVPAGEVEDAFETAYARWWASREIDAEPVLRTFNLSEHSDAIQRFRKLDDEFSDLTRRYIRARLCAGIPPKDSESQPQGFSFLAYQLTLQRHRKTVREMIEGMGPALTTLAPCLLMSPLSVAQYLPADTALFDLVIFDEASQITPWDAVGAMARGKQVIVAGDPKQMPPTSFFDRGAAAADDDADDQEDQESILEECLGARLPQRRLTWHYRSRHESLIAFSNHRYYDGDLVTFPAPVTRDSAVTLVPVAGAWARGKARTNQVEAEAIVAEAVRRLSDPGFVDEKGKSLSLAIITLNAEQQKLVEDLLDKARQKQPSLERFFAEDAAEPVVVKNLETVQGDERDVILLGIGFGPETPGAPSMAMNFGPLNRSGGWRRLNVAVTRARREMMVFASFPPHLVDLNRTRAEAVRDLKHFLEYAQRGPRALGEAVVGSVGGFESPFERAVARGLRGRGWTVVPQIGVSRYRIDLGVVNPERQGDYLVGVECDGAAYHSAATARDRDKVREAVLRSLGWSLLRVWSTDWWIDARGALDRLDAALKEELEAFRQRKAAEPVFSQSDDAEEVADGTVADDNDTASTELLGGSYRLTPLNDLNPNRDRFNDPAYISSLQAMIGRVVTQEAPIRDDVLVERVARAHGIARSGPNVRARILLAARESVFLRPEGSGSVFIWLSQADQGDWAEARAPATSADIRQIEDIALEELAAALRAAKGSDPMVEASRFFGIRRLSAGARARLQMAYNHLNSIEPSSDAAPG